MAKRVSNEDIIKMNEMYLAYHSYAEVARQTGWSAGTVKRYIDPNYVSVEPSNIIRFTEEPRQIDILLFRNTENWGDFCVLGTGELKEIEVLHTEMQA